jgi:hypothetical protein
VAEPPSGEEAPPPAAEAPSDEAAPPFPDETPAPLEEALPSEESAPAAPARKKRRSLIPMLICLLITAVGFGLLGYYVGQIKKVPADIVEIPDAQIPASPIPPDGTEPKPKPKPRPVAPPIIPPTGPGPADPPVANTDLAPEAALRAFLNAADWERRSIHVLWPDKIRPLMKKYAAEHGDGPIPYRSIEFTDGDGGNRFFQVFTEDIPDGFPVAVIASDEGPKIEWETFIGFHDDHFRHFIEGPVNKTGAFDLLIWPADPVEEGNAWLYQLRAPIPGRETVAYARKDSTASARLTALFNGADGIDKEALKEFARDGVPIALKLAKRSMTDGTPYIEILEVISVGWISGEP